MRDLIWAFEVHYPPESLALHVLIGQAMVGERLIPHGVAGVSQSLCAKLIGLLDARSDQDKEMESSYNYTELTPLFFCYFITGSAWYCFSLIGLVTLH